jgi:hypothetical protein
LHTSSTFPAFFRPLTPPRYAIALLPPTGGKGTPRRKQVKKSVTSAQGDDRKLQAALKKLGVTPITGVEEVNMFKEDGNVLHFGAPKGAY